MNYLFQINETQPQHAIAVRTITEKKDFTPLVAEAFDKLLAYLAPYDQLAIGPSYIAYHGMDGNKLDVEIGFPVSEHLEGDGEIKGTTIEGGRRVVGYYKGSYDYMPYFHEEIFKWILLNELEPSGLVYEYYFNSPGNVADSELLTRIEFMIR